MIVGIGVDVVDIARFEQALARTPGLRERLFTPAERPLHPRSLAARFAAKEALAKALGAPPGLGWLDAQVDVGEHGRPYWSLSGTVEKRCRAMCITDVHLSMSHDAGVATAFVVAEAANDGPAPAPATTPTSPPKRTGQ